jgi:replication-associated recombination protein RarA
MSNDLAIHPATSAKLNAFFEQPTHALLLLGPTGSGKGVLAIHIAAQVLGIQYDKITTHPYVKVIASPDGKAIGIEAIRSLDHFLSLKVPSQSAINRVVIIENSHLLTLEAQNALLKTLEEPPQGTVLILTANNSHTLLPTITSRTQAIAIQPPGSNQLKAYFQNKYPDAKDIDRLYAMSGGLPGLLDALLSDGSHPLLTSAEMARTFMQGSVFDRLRLTDSLAKQRQATDTMLYVMQQMAHLSLRTAEGQAARRWQSVLEHSYEAYMELQENAQPKLVLTRLALHI